MRCTWAGLFVVISFMALSSSCGINAAIQGTLGSSSDERGTIEAAQSPLIQGQGSSLTELWSVSAPGSQYRVAAGEIVFTKTPDGGTQVSSILYTHEQGHFYPILFPRDSRSLIRGNVVLFLDEIVLNWHSHYLNHGSLGSGIIEIPASGFIELLSFIKAQLPNSGTLPELAKALTDQALIQSATNAVFLKFPWLTDPALAPDGRSFSTNLAIKRRDLERFLRLLSAAVDAGWSGMSDAPSPEPIKAYLDYVINALS